VPPRARRRSSPARQTPKLNRHSLISRHGFLALALALAVASIGLAGGTTSGSATPRALGARDSGSSGNWQAAALDLTQAWGVTQGSPTVAVAIVDSGVAGDDPRLRGRVLPGYDFVHGQNGAADDNGHGTALAGIVVSTCPRCSILPVKVLNSSAQGDWGTIAAGVTWAADHGAQVINLSVGASRAPDTLRNAVAYAVGKGAIVVAAAGNEGVNEPFYPASYPGVISVAGVDERQARYSWSNFGSWVTAAAPGCATAAWLGGGTVTNFCGTSTAAPFVAGVAGLARSFAASVSPAAFAAARGASTTPLPDAGIAAHGIVDANRTLVALGAPTGPPLVTVAPRLVPKPVVGRLLVAFPGTWRQASSTLVTWERSRDGRSWQPVGRGRTYIPRRSDLGFRLRVEVRAVNVRGATAATSTATAPIRRNRAQHA
jgi:hypothetical protein